MMTEPNFRALCAELVELLEDEWYGVTREPSALVNARAALAQPEPQGPTGRPAIEPVPVSERLPGPEDCDLFERVWAFNPVLDHWKVTRINQSIHTHWLPYWALPVPGVEGKP
jgi:hypothetical protein